MANRKLTFELWKARVNAAIRTKCGMDADDLPDCSYYDWYEAGVTPATAARRAISEAADF